MAQNPVSLKWVPLTTIDQDLVTAKMVCGANGANLGAWQAVTDASFKISIDGVLLSLTAIDLSATTDLANVADQINYAAAGRFICRYDSKGDVFQFLTNNEGIRGTVSVLTAGAAGTDVSGAGFLNGLTAVGTATAGSGNDGENTPAGIYTGGSITAAELVAGDVVNRPVLVGGEVTIDVEQLILENSLDLDDIVVETQQTIRQMLYNIGIRPEVTRAGDLTENA